MIMQTKILRRNGRQSVQIPSEFALPDGVDEVTIMKSGADLLISPVPAQKLKEFLRTRSMGFGGPYGDPPPQEGDSSD